MSEAKNASDVYNDDSYLCHPGMAFATSEWLTTISQKPVPSRLTRSDQTMLRFSR
jgi:hypothetical protein